MQAVTITQITPIELRQIIREEYQIYLNEAKPTSIPSPPKSEGYITETEARKLLGGISKPTAWKYRKHGIIQGYRFGRMVRYKESEILASLSKITAKK